MYYIERFGNFWQSVFPEQLAHESALHRTIEDATEWIKSIAGDVEITVVK